MALAPSAETLVVGVARIWSKRRSGMTLKLKATGGTPKVDALATTFNRWPLLPAVKRTVATPLSSVCAACMSRTAPAGSPP